MNCGVKNDAVFDTFYSVESTHICLLKYDFFHFFCSICFAKLKEFFFQQNCFLACDVFRQKLFFFHSLLNFLRLSTLFLAKLCLRPLSANIRFKTTSSQPDLIFERKLSSLYFVLDFHPFHHTHLLKVSNYQNIISFNLSLF